MAGQPQWTRLRPYAIQSSGGAILKLQEDASILVSGTRPEKDVYTLTAECPLETVTAFRLEALTDASLPRKGPGRSPQDPNFVVSEFTIVHQSSKGGIPVELTKPRANFSQRNWDISGAIDGKTETGWAISPKAGNPHVAVFEASNAIAGTGSQLKLTISQQYGGGLVLGRFRLSVSSADPKSLTVQLPTIRELVAIPMQKRTKRQQQQIDQAFRDVYPATAKLGKQLAALNTI